MKLAKWATIIRNFVLLVPNALTHGDPANTVPLPALAVNFQEGDTQTTRTVGIAKLDMATRMIEYFVVEASGRPTTKTAHLLYLQARAACSTAWMRTTLISTRGLPCSTMTCPRAKVSTPMRAAAHRMGWPLYFASSLETCASGLSTIRNSVPAPSPAEARVSRTRHVVLPSRDTADNESRTRSSVHCSLALSAEPPFAISTISASTCPYPLPSGLSLPSWPQASPPPLVSPLATSLPFDACCGAPVLE